MPMKLHRIYIVHMRVKHIILENVLFPSQHPQAYASNNFFTLCYFLKTIIVFLLWKEATNLEEASNEAQRDNDDRKRREMDL